MRANAKLNGRPTLRLRTDEFDKLAAAVIGAPSNKALAERLGIDEAHLSGLRRHRHTPGEKFIVACKTLMPHVAFEQLFEIVEPAEAGDAA